MKALLLALLILASCTLQEVQNTTADVSESIALAKDLKSECGALLESKDSTSYNTCVQTVALARKDPELCKYSLDGKKDNPLYLPESIACVYAVVNVTKDPAYCETLNGSNSYAIPYSETCTHYARSD